MLSNEYVVIGEHTYGKPHVLRWADTDGKLFIGKYCSIAANVKIYLGGTTKQGGLRPTRSPQNTPSSASPVIRRRKGTWSSATTCGSEMRR